MFWKGGKMWLTLICVLVFLRFISIFQFHVEEKKRISLRGGKTDWETYTEHVRTVTEFVRACECECERERERVRVCMCALPTRTSAYVIVLNKRKRWMLYDVRVGGRERERERRRGTKPCSHLLSLNFTMSVGLPLNFSFVLYFLTIFLFFVNLAILDNYLFSASITLCLFVV